MGFEKIEPGTQRRDVDRRFTALRKTQIRNTAQRYRFNVITQKFNTYSMYWTRVCRQIEEGTFKRHVAKAARRFGASEPKREMEYSIDVDLGDFEDLDDVNALLAEANAAAEAYARAGTTDTLPPQLRTEPPTSQPPWATSGEPAALEIKAPDTSFAMVGRRETFDSALDELDASPSPLNGGSPRPARHAALPQGAKPRILVRRRNPSTPDPTEQAEPLNLGPDAAPVRPPMGSSPDRPGPPSVSVIRPSPSSAPTPNRPAPSAPQLRGAPPADSAKQIPPSSPDLARRVASATPSDPIPGPIPTSPGRPAAAPVPPASSTAGGRVLRPASSGGPVVRPMVHPVAAAQPSPGRAAIPPPAGTPAAAVTTAQRTAPVDTNVAGAPTPRVAPSPSGSASRPSIPPGQERASRRPPPLPSQLKK